MQKFDNNLGKLLRMQNKLVQFQFSGDIWSFF